jgi:hypothetical protein
MVVRIEVDTSGLSKMSAWVADLQGQLPYATSRALNDTARQAAADLLLEVMQDPGLQTRYLRDVLPLVAEVHLGTSWAETH